MDIKEKDKKLLRAGIAMMAIGIVITLGISLLVIFIAIIAAFVL